MRAVCISTLLLMLPLLQSTPTGALLRELEDAVRRGATGWNYYVQYIAREDDIHRTLYPDFENPINPEENYYHNVALYIQETIEKSVEKTNEETPSLVDQLRGRKFQTLVASSASSGSVVTCSTVVQEHEQRCSQQGGSLEVRLELVHMERLRDGNLLREFATCIVFFSKVDEGDFGEATQAAFSEMVQENGPVEYWIREAGSSAQRVANNLQAAPSLRSPRGTFVGFRRQVGFVRRGRNANGGPRDYIESCAVWAPSGHLFYESLTLGDGRGGAVGAEVYLLPAPEV